MEIVRLAFQIAAEAVIDTQANEKFPSNTSIELKRSKSERLSFKDDFNPYVCANENYTKARLA